MYSTFIGGNDQLGGDGGRAIVLDAKYQAYVVGTTGDDCDGVGAPLISVPKVPALRARNWCFGAS